MQFCFDFETSWFSFSHTFKFCNSDFSGQLKSAPPEMVSKIWFKWPLKSIILIGSQGCQSSSRKILLSASFLLWCSLLSLHYFQNCLKSMVTRARLNNLASKDFDLSFSQRQGVIVTFKTFAKHGLNLSHLQLLQMRISMRSQFLSNFYQLGQERVWFRIL